MLRSLDGYSYYHQLAQTHVLLSTQLTVQATNTNHSLLRVWDVVLQSVSMHNACHASLATSDEDEGTEVFLGC